MMGKLPNTVDECHEHRDVSRTERSLGYAVLRDDRCRTVLSTLDRNTPMDERALAAAVVAAERDVPLDAVTAADAEHVRYELYHIHLPKLEATGFVSWADGTVQTCLTERHEVVAGARAFVEADRSTAAAYLHHLSNADRRAALTVLSTAEGPMELAALSTAMERLHERPRDEHTHDRLCLALHHVHLPTLHHVGLVRYDHETRVVELATLAPPADEAV